MPKVYLTKEQQRGHKVKKIINDYVFESGSTKKKLIEEANIPTRRFYERLKNPEDFTLGELWSLFDTMGTPPEERAKILE